MDRIWKYVINIGTILFIFIVIGDIIGMVIWSKNIKNTKKLSLSKLEDYILERNICDTMALNNSQIFSFEGIDCNSKKCENVHCAEAYRPSDYRCTEMMIDYQGINFTVHIEKCFSSVDMDRILTNKKLDINDSFGFIFLNTVGSIILTMCSMVVIRLFYLANKKTILSYFQPKYDGV